MEKHNKILVANRGEIAVRILRTCRELGMETVAVYSTADKESLHVRLADQAVCVGPPASRDSYLVQSNIIAAAIKTGCTAVHPGVGFLSENSDFARLVEDQDLRFIGPAPEVLELLGDKLKARETAASFGLPLTPGTKNAVEDPAAALESASELGLPVLIKAAAGGGGKGMRIVRDLSKLAENFNLAQQEAEANFGDKRVFIERFIENPRHVELQLLCNGKTALVLGERDCSIQRNHQKLIEESPAPGFSNKMRNAMSEGAVQMFQELGYEGAGTVEFLVEKDKFYFMEVNARVQVEHPVSEFVSGVDLIREQILACLDKKLDITKPRLNGCAMECRINALTPGKVTGLQVPGGPWVRFDTYLTGDCMVPPYYDALVGKLIVYAPNREQVLARLSRALGELVIEGIKTNIEEQARIIQHPVFRSGAFGNNFIEKELGG